MDDPSGPAPFVSLQVLRPLRQRFLDLVNRDDFAQISQQEAVRREVVATLEALCGIAEATQVDNVAALFSFLVDFLSGCIGLMEVRRQPNKGVFRWLFSSTLNSQIRGLVKTTVCVFSVLPCFLTYIYYIYTLIYI